MRQFKSINEFARANGFENAKDMHHLIATADISTQEKLAAFYKWRDEDGTKTGLEKLADDK